MEIKVQVGDFMLSTFEITDEESIRLSENSIERVINLSIHVLEQESKSDLGMVAEDDLKELKRLVCRLWYSAQQAVFAAKGNMK